MLFQSFITIRSPIHTQECLPILRPGDGEVDCEHDAQPQEVHEPELELLGGARQRRLPVLQKL